MKLLSKIDHNVTKVFKKESGQLETKTFCFKDSKAVEVPDAFANALVNTYPEKYSVDVPVIVNEKSKDKNAGK